MAQTQPFYLRGPALHILCLLGALTTWGLCIADGTVSHLLVALHGPSEYVLPGSSATLRSTFTHIFPVDYLLRMLVIFFWEPAYGRLPATSATGVYFLGQVFPIMTAVCLDGVRGGSSRAPKSRLLTAMMWLFLFQMTGMATTGGLWVLSFVNTSPTTSTVASLSTLRQASLVSRSTGLIVLVAMVLGYAVPGVAMGFHSPTFVSSDFQQWAIAAWNVYPIWVFLFVKAGELVASRFFPEPSHAQRSGNKGEVVANSTRHNHLKAVRLVSAATLITGFAVHIAVSAVSISTVLFPAIFQDRYRAEFDPVSLILPPLSIAQAETVGDGIRSFMIWDQVFAYTFSLIVMLAQLGNVARLSDYQMSTLQSVGLCTLSCFVLGPGSTCMALSWLRDEILFSEGETSEKEK